MAAAAVPSSPVDASHHAAVLDEHRTAAPAATAAARKRRRSAAPDDAPDRLRGSTQARAAALVAGGAAIADTHRRIERQIDAFGMRHIRPYEHTYACFAKARWLRRTLLDVFSREFGSHDEAYFKRAIECGAIRVDGAVVAPTHAISDSELITHSLHKHEPAVPADAPVVIDETDDFVVFEKPAGIPVHACGPYHYNTLVSLACVSLPGLSAPPSPLHRLDRLTSGLTVTGKRSSARVKEFQERMQNGGIRKRYLACVRGSFPSAPPHPRIRCAADDGMLRERTLANGLQVAAPVALHAAPAASVPEASETCPFLRAFTPGLAEFELHAQGNVDDSDGPVHMPVRADGADAAPGASAADGRVFWCEDGWLCVHVALMNANSRNMTSAPVTAAAAQQDADDISAHHKRPQLARDSTTLFRLLHQVGGCSVVECRPLSGRTHQLRVHLAWLGFPIDNDPKYNVDAFRSLMEADARDAAAPAPEPSWRPDAPHALAGTDAPAAAGRPSTDVLRSICTACNRGIRAEFNASQRLCHGIHLHSLQYAVEGGNTWTSRIPAWARAESVRRPGVDVSTAATAVTS